ncbi:MAG: MerR family transcriptional regulator [Bacteroidia bacterium]|nr:MerR family transcriptional regulator [Bacteroidia bacterium]
MSREITKRYYSISEVAERFNVSQSLIRFWEKEFDNLRPTKNSKGDRRFTEKNLIQFKLIYHLLKEKGFTIKGAKQEIKENRAKYIMKQKVVEKLEKLKSGIEDLKDQI